MTADLRLELDLVEEGIATDPHHRFRRKDRDDGTTVDYSAAKAGLLVAFEIIDDETVELIELRDLTSA